MKEISREVERCRIPLSWLFAGLLIALLSVSRSGWEGFYEFLITIQSTVGVVLVGIASVGRLWCSLYIAGYKRSGLVTLGPYSMCRHPLYFFSFLGWVGVGLATESFLIPLIIALGFMAYYPHVIRSEEAEMSRLHGEKFKEYSSRVPKFLPKISNFTEPDEYVVRPMIFRKHMLDAVWFVWFLGIVEIIEHLHEVGFLPTAIKIY